MATEWTISGDYFETCNCDYLCPCISTHLAATPTQGYCDVALVFHIDKGTYGDLSLDGLNFAVLVHTPSAMGDGNWTAGVITDANGSAAQQEALVAIASGQGGGPMATLAPLITNFAGVEAKQIDYQIDGNSRSVFVDGMLDQALEGVGGGDPNAVMVLENAPHPASSRLALAKATRSHLHGFGIDWDETGGNNNGHFSPFSWSG